MGDQLGAIAVVSHLVMQLQHSRELKRKQEHQEHQLQQEKRQLCEEFNRQVEFLVMNQQQKQVQKEEQAEKVNFVQRDLTVADSSNEEMEVSEQFHVSQAAAPEELGVSNGEQMDMNTEAPTPQQDGIFPSQDEEIEVQDRFSKQVEEESSTGAAADYADDNDEELVGGSGTVELNQRQSGTVVHHQKLSHEHLVARIGLTSGGLAKSIELYGDYVVRQIGLNKDTYVAKELSEAAMGYLMGDKSQDDRSRVNLLGFLSRACKSLNDQRLMTLNEELMKELDACMVSYFAFHWKHSGHLLDQVRTGQRKLRNIVIAATRKHRFQRAMAVLKGKRAFTTLVEMIKAMGKRQVMHDEQGRRAPVLLLVGGGMGAGKSTVVKNILSGSAPTIVRPDAVVVEADAFKETDALYRALSLSSGAGDISMASQVVHDSSTRAASSLLVSALNEGRDVVFDGTMSWEPFVMQTIEMARDVHRHRYRLGPGYQVADDGTVVEQYWEKVTEEAEAETTRKIPRAAYRIELVGVTSGALLAVVRGIRRAIISNRFVPINGQLRSHKLFAASLETYCREVDAARVFCTNNTGVPQLIGSKEGHGNCLKWVDEGARKFVRELAELNPNATSVLELKDEQCKAWSGIALSSERSSRQQALREMLTNSMSAPVTPASSSLQWDDDSSSSSITSNSSMKSSSSSSTLLVVGDHDFPTSLSSSSLSSLSSTSSGSSGTSSSSLVESSSNIDIASLEEDF